MRCPICDQMIDHTHGHAAPDAQTCPVCRAICREADEAEQSHYLETAMPTQADRPLIPTKRTPGVEDVFNWY